MIAEGVPHAESAILRDPLFRIRARLISLHENVLKLLATFLYAKREAHIQLGTRQVASIDVDQLSGAKHSANEEEERGRRRCFLFHYLNQSRGGLTAVKNIQL